MGTSCGRGKTMIVLSYDTKYLFQSLSALLKTAVHDEDDVVRQTAQKVLNKHPKAGNITLEQENIVLR